MRRNFFKHTPKLIIFNTHNLQTFKYYTLINELLLVEFYLFNIRHKLHHWSDENNASHCSELSQLHQQPVDAVLRPTFIWKLCYKLQSVVTFTFIQMFDEWTAPCWQAVWRITYKIHVIFGVWFESRKSDKKANLHKNWSIQTLF